MLKLVPGIVEARDADRDAPIPRLERRDDRPALIPLQRKWALDRAFLVPSGAGDELYLASSLFKFILKISAPHQLGLAAITTLLFLVSAVPLELQRRIVNSALQRGEFASIGILALAYFSVTLAQRGIKLVMNVYRGWVSENSTRHVRSIVLAAAGRSRILPSSSRRGVDISIVLTEADPIGNFVGVSFSEPLLQCGVLISLFSYMTYLQPWMALIAVCTLAPQILYIPAMQNAINRRATARILTLRSISAALNRGITGANATSRPLKRVARVFDLNMSIYKIKYSMNFLMNGSFHLSMAGILALGGYYIAIGKIDAGSVIACTASLSKISDPWDDLVNWFRELRVTQAKYALIRAAGLHALESDAGTQQIEHNAGVAGVHGDQGRAGRCVGAQRHGYPMSHLPHCGSLGESDALQPPELAVLRRAANRRVAVSRLQHHD